MKKIVFFLVVIILIVIAFGGLYVSDEPIQPPTPTVSPMPSTAPTTPPIEPTPTPTPTAPTITISEQPISVGNIYQGESVRFDLTASSSNGAVITYQWFVNDTNAIHKGTALSGEDSDIYRLLCDFIGTRYFFCSLSIDGGDIIYSEIVSVTSISRPPPPKPTPTATPICSTCKGSGTVTCSGCNGLGANGSSNQLSGCGGCGGSGNTVEGNLVNGSGSKPCPNC